MSSESVCQVARSWVDVGSFYTRLVMRYMKFYSARPEYFGYTLILPDLIYAHLSELACN
jgi:hypothetical protein